MVPELALMLPPEQTVAVSAYIDFLPDLQVSIPLGTSRFLKTVKCLSQEGEVVVKVLIKPIAEQVDLQPVLEQMETIRQRLQNVPNVLPFHTIIDSQRACYLLRPYARYSLHEKLSVLPFLEDIEKRWVVYQLLNALARIHAQGVTHGDLKTENILLTSWNWCLVGDFATLKPVYLPEADPSQFSFYFDTSQRHACYLAPERFVAEADNKGQTVTPEMDVFSLGCVIAEIYSDGLSTFTLPQMFKYRKGEYTPNLDGIAEPGIRTLVRGMLSRDPSQRKSAQWYLSKAGFPDYFRFLHAYIGELTHTKASQRDCDLRIHRIYTDFARIAARLEFKEQYVEEPIKGESLLPLPLTFPGLPSHIPRRTSEIFTEKNPPSCASLLLLSVVLYNVRTCTHASFRIEACQLILAFAEQLPDEAKLDRCLPYLVHLLKDPSDDVQSAALRSLAQLLTMVDTVPPVNVSLFPDYILPALDEFWKHSSAYARTVFAACLPHMALAARRLYDLSTLQTRTFRDPETENNNLVVAVESSMDRNYARLLAGFERLTIGVMTDSSAAVRIGLLTNILPLCTFFGRDKTNDVILSHLITYLNDRDPQLKVAFVASTVTISVFVGIVCMEQYVLPVLVQALTDPSELVELELVRVLTSLVRLGLIRKHHLWDLVRMTVRLLLHPNRQIRQAVLDLVLAVGDTLSVADVYCMLYPVIRPYFRQEVTFFSWQQLYLGLHSPIPRAVFNIAKNWATSHEPTLFWQMGPRGKYASKSGGREFPLSVEDSRQVERLRNIGFPHADLWKIAILRSYIYRVSRAAVSEDDSPEYKSNILPRSVFLDVSYKEEARPKRRAAKKDAKAKPTSQPLAPQHSLTPTIASHPLFLKSSLPSVGQSEENASAFGKASDFLVVGGESVVSGGSEFSVLPESKGARRLVQKTKHSYTGDNQYIRQFLASHHYSAPLDEYKEFGPQLKFATPADASIDASTDRKSSPPILVARLVEHTCRVTCLAVSSDAAFFVSGDEKGQLKFWDAGKLESTVPGGSFFSLNLGAEIQAVQFMRTRQCLVVATKDGAVKLFRVDADKRSPSIVLIREYKVPEEEGSAVLVEFSELGEIPYVIYATPTSRVVYLDLRTLERALVVENDASHGIPTSLAVGPGRSWLLVGTSRGVLDLWDTSFELLVKSVKFRQACSPVTAIRVLPDRFRGSKGACVATIGGTGVSDVTIWDVSRMRPQMVLCSALSGNSVEKYSVEELEAQLQALQLTAKSIEEDRSCTALDVACEAEGRVYAVCATHQGKVIEWDLGSPGASRVLSGESEFTESQISSDLVVVNELEKRAGTRQDVQGLSIVQGPSMLVICSERSGSLVVYR